MPTEGYLEGPGGPLPLLEIEWVEISMSRVKGGIAGHPLQFIDIKDEILSRLPATQVRWALHDATWSKARIFENRPVEVVRIVNLFGARPGP